MSKSGIFWTKSMLEEFISEALLTEDEEFIMRTRLAGWSIVKQSMERNISTATVSNIITRIKSKYDILAERLPEKFPKRKDGNKIEEMLDDTSRDFTFRVASLCRSCTRFKDNKTAEDLLCCYEDCKYKLDGYEYK